MIALLVPSRKRPKLLKQMHESALDMAKNPDDIHTYVYIDDDDDSYDQMHYMHNMHFISGPRMVLSQMWNKCFERASGEYYGHMGDDVVFRTKDWDEMILYSFPKDNVAFVHGRDGSPHDESGFGTHGFLHRDWVKAVGYFVPPYFAYDFNDTWLNDVSDIIDRHVFVEDVLIEHLHPAWRKREADEVTLEMQAKGREQNVKELYDSKIEERKRDARKLQALVDTRSNRV